MRVELPVGSCDDVDPCEALCVSLALPLWLELCDWLGLLVPLAVELSLGDWVWLGDPDWDEVEDTLALLVWLFDSVWLGLCVCVREPDCVRVVVGVCDEVPVPA